MSIAAASLVQFALLMLAAILAAAFALGVLVAVRPGTLERLRRTGAPPLSLRRFTRAFDTPHDIDPWFYRHHRLYGAAAGILAVVLLGYLTFGQVGDRWVSLLDPRWQNVGAVLAQSARIVLWIFGVFALIIAAVVFTRPSALKGLEAHVNRWITPRQPLRGLDREIHAPDRWAVRHPRWWGSLIALISGASLLALLLQIETLTRGGA